MISQDKAKDLVNTLYYSLPNNGSTEGLNSTTRRYEEAKQCALIAEDFAIGFAYWCEWCDYKAFKTYEELLEIYKKEKGL